MYPQTTQQDRQQVADHWRTHGQSQGFAPNQVEDLAQRILTGGADDQVGRLMAQSTNQLAGQQQQQQPPSSLAIQTPFGMFSLPPMSMPNFPTMCMPTFPSPAVSPSMSGMPQSSMPMIAQQTRALPNGNGLQQNTAFSGQQGLANVSHSSSSTSFSTANRNTNSTVGIPQAPTLSLLDSALTFALPRAVEQTSVRCSFGTPLQRTAHIPLGRLDHMLPPQNLDFAAHVRQVLAEDSDSSSDDSDSLDERILQTRLHDLPGLADRSLIRRSRDLSWSPRQRRRLGTSNSESDSDSDRSPIGGRRGLGGIGDDLDRALESVSLARGAIRGATQHLRRQRRSRQR